MNKRQFLTTLGTAIMAMPMGYVGGKIAGNSAEIGQNNITEQKKSEIFTKVAQEGQALRTAYVNYPPGFNKNLQTGEFEGIFYELLEQMAKDLDIDLQWTEEVTFAGLFEGFKTGRYDMVGSGVWKNPARSKQCLYSEPVYYSGIAAYVRADDQRIDDIEKLDTADITIATIDGEMTQHIANGLFPAAQQVQLPEITPVSDALLNVITGKADVTFVEDEVANRFLASNPNSLRRLETVVAMPTCVLLPNGEERFKQLIDDNIEILANSGVIEKILKQNELVAGTLLRLAKPYAETSAHAA